MSRPIKQDWFETFLTAKNVMAELGSSCTATEVAHRLQLNPKLMSRILMAGRFVEQYLPEGAGAELSCSYSAIETLDRIMRLSPQAGQELIPQVLKCEITVAEVMRRLDALRSEHSVQVDDLSTRSAKRRDSRSTRKRLYALLPTLGTDWFGVSEGIFCRVDKTPYASPAAMILNSDGTYGAALFTKMGADFRDFRGVAMELYGFAQLQQSLASIIWLIFPKRNDVLLCLAEIKRHMEQDSAQDSPDWLRLAYLKEEGGVDRLHALGQEDMADIEHCIAMGQRRFNPEDLKLKLSLLQDLEESELKYQR